MEAINDYTEYVKIQTTDENGVTQLIHIPVLHTRMSGTLTDLLKEVGGSTDQPIPLPRVDNETMVVIAKYLAYHFEHPDEHENFSGITKGFEDIGAWDKPFVESLSRELLTKVTLAANYLNINDLLMLCCKQHAANIKDMTHKQKNEYLGIREQYVRPLRKNCPHCSQSNRMESEFCVKCGNSFKFDLNNDNNAVSNPEPMDETTD